MLIKSKAWHSLRGLNAMLFKGMSWHSLIAINHVDLKFIMA